MKLRFIVPVLLVVAFLAACEQPPDAPLSPPPPATTSYLLGGDTTCLYLPEGQPAKPVNPPATDSVPTKGTVDLTIHLSAGDVKISLNRSQAPCAVNSFLSLVEQGYFDNTECHRLAVGFVLQCGDPTATGVGGPGYRFADELSGRETYTRGLIAMANSGADTNGSQFFIMLEDAAWMKPSYVVLGSVYPDSMAPIDAIADKGGDEPDNPQGSRPVWGNQISSITID